MLKPIEPEIIPPDRGDHSPRAPSGVFVRVDQRDGVQRVYIGRPSILAIIIGLMIVGFVGALAFLAMVGLLLVWMPILIGAILLGLIRYRWRALRTWWSGGRNVTRK